MIRMPLVASLSALTEWPTSLSSVGSANGLPSSRCRTSRHILKKELGQEIGLAVPRFGIIGKVGAAEEAKRSCREIGDADWIGDSPQRGIVKSRAVTTFGGDDGARNAFLCHLRCSSSKLGALLTVELGAL